MENLIKQIHEYALSKVGVTSNYKAEWDWQRFHVGDKLFLTYSENSDKGVSASIKLEPEHGKLLREKYDGIVVPGYYMNKVHWNTIYLANKEIDFAFLKPLIDEAYDISFLKLTKKKQKELLGE